MGIHMLLTLPSNTRVNMTTVWIRPSQIILQKSSSEFSVGPVFRQDVYQDSYGYNG